MSAVPRKILCLPGYLQSGKIFAEKSSGLRKPLTKKLNLDLDYISPPVVLNDKSELPFSLGTDEEADAKWKSIVELECNRCWWKHTEPFGYEGFDESLKYLVNYIKENGPYQGILGFSQGAAMAAALNNVIEDVLPGHPSFELAIFISGFVFTTPVNENDDKYDLFEIQDVDVYRQKVKVVEGFEKYFDASKAAGHIVNIYGTGDATVPSVRSRHLSTIYDSNRLSVLEHDGGHYVPSKKHFVNPIIEIIKDVLDTKSNL